MKLMSNPKCTQHELKLPWNTQLLIWHLHMVKEGHDGFVDMEAQSMWVCVCVCEWVWPVKPGKISGNVQHMMLMLSVWWW